VTKRKHTNGILDSGLVLDFELIVNHFAFLNQLVNSQVLDLERPVV
jgi:hypothetical protein